MLKHLRPALQILALTLVLLGTAVGQVFAAAYGSGNYGEGSYNVGVTPASHASSNSSSSGGGGSPSPSLCTSGKPASAPDLFQMSAKATSATLYFSPSSGQWDRYFVSYSTNPSAQEYGFEFMNSSNGVVSVDVSSLKARTVYYFRVRAGNGCQPGDWSNILSVQTGQRFPIYRWSALPRIVTTAIRRTAQPTSIQRVKVDTATQPASPAPTVSESLIFVPTTPAAKSLDGQQADAPAAPSFLQRVGNFFRGLWKN